MQQELLFFVFFDAFQIFVCMRLSQQMRRFEEDILDLQPCFGRICVGSPSAQVKDKKIRMRCRRLLDLAVQIRNPTNDPLQILPTPWFH
jgi:hypothetical protein